MARQKSLERKIAEVQSLLDEISYRYVNCTCPDQGFTSSIGALLEGLGSMEENYRLSLASLEKRKSESGRYFSEFALDTKNFANNLNLFLQYLYSIPPPQFRNENLKKLESSLITAPKTDSGKSLYEVYSAVHAFSNQDVLVALRNIKGHNRGELIIQPSEYSLSGYRINIAGLSSQKVLDAKEWISGKMNDYLDMATTILATIAEKEKTLLVNRQDVSSYLEPVRKKMWKNWKARHQATVQAIAIAAAVSTGVFGTLLVQQINERNRERYESRQIERMLDAAYETHWGSYDWKVFDKTSLPSSEFETIKRELSSNSKSLGILVDNYLNCFSSEEEPSKKVRLFLAERDLYLRRLRNLQYNENSANGALTSIKELHDLLKEKSRLEKMESEITSGIPHRL